MYNKAVRIGVIGNKGSGKTKIIEEMSRSLSSCELIRHKTGENPYMKMKQDENIHKNIYKKSLR